MDAAAPHPQAPGRWLRDCLAAQLTRAPGSRHTWGHKAGREGTGLCAAGSASGLEEHGVLGLLPQGRGSTGWGHSIVSLDGRAGEPHVHRARLQGSRISNWAGGKIPPQVRAEAAASPSAQTPKQSHKKHQEPGTVTLPRVAEKPREPGTMTLPRAAVKLQENGRSTSPLIMENNCPEAAQ